MSHNRLVRVFYRPVPVRDRKRLPFALAALLLTLTACGGGGGSASPSAPAPTSTPDTSPQAVAVSPASLSFLAAGGSVPAQTVAVTQSQNSGGFTLSTTDCGAIASASPTTGAGPFSFAPLAAGTCSYLVTGSGGHATSVSITVTTTAVVSK